MSTIESITTFLPPEVKMGIIEHCDLPSLAAFGQTDRLFKILTDRLLPNIIKAIQCPPSQGSPIQQIKSHVEELYAKADKLKDDRIQHLLTQPKTLENVSLLQKFLKARDILILWHYLLPNNAPQLDQLLTCDDVIAKAEGFSAVFNQHKQQLIPNTTSLSLNNKNLTHIPSELFELSNLQNLSLRFNILTEIPDEIGNLKNLMTLCLENNSLKTLPSQIVALKQLLVLLLRNNKLESLPPGMSSFTTLLLIDFRNNRLSSLPSDFQQITCTELYIKKNQFSSLPHFPNVWHLHCDDPLRPLTTPVAKVSNYSRKKIIAAVGLVVLAGLAYYNTGLICPSLFN